MDSYFKNLKFWMKLSGTDKAFVLYSGQKKQQRSNGIVVENWRDYLAEKNNSPDSGHGE